MPRIRTVKPDFFDDKKLSKLSIQARFIYIGMWVFADDEGVISASESWLKSKLFPHNPEIKLSKFSSWITEMKILGRLEHFHYNGEDYFLIHKMILHQRIDKPQASKLPKIVIDKIRGMIQERSNNVLPSIVKDKYSKGEDSIERAKALEEKVFSEAPKPDQIPDSEKKKKTRRKKENDMKPKPDKKKSPKPPTEFWDELVKLWYDFYFERFNINPTLNGASLKNYKLIIANLKKRSVEKHTEWNLENSKNTIFHFLTLAYQDSFLRKNFTLQMMNNQFDKIIANGQAATKHGLNGKTVNDDLARNLAQQLASIGSESRK